MPMQVEVGLRPSFDSAALRSGRTGRGAQNARWGERRACPLGMAYPGAPILTFPQRGEGIICLDLSQRGPFDSALLGSGYAAGLPIEDGLRGPSTRLRVLGRGGLRLRCAYDARVGGGLCLLPVGLGGYPTRNTFITSSPRWLITFTAMRPDSGLGKGREVSLLRVAQASSSISALRVVFSDL